MKRKRKFKIGLIIPILLLFMFVFSFQNEEEYLAAPTGYTEQTHFVHSYDRKVDGTKVETCLYNCGYAMDTTYIHYIYACNGKDYRLYQWAYHDCRNPNCGLNGEYVSVYDVDNKWEKIEDYGEMNYAGLMNYILPEMLACPGFDYPNTYYVKYNGNGATSGSMANSTHTYDSAAYLNANAFKKTGYTFQGWSTSSTATTATYKDSASVKNLTATNGATVNLYAIWKANTYTVTFLGNGGSPTSSTKSVTYNGTYGTLPTPTRTGYTFLGWYTAISGGTKVTSSTKVSITSNQSLYAHWQSNAYTVTYDGNGGTSENNTATVSYNTAVNLNVKAEKDGYVFVGWNTNPNATSPLSSYTMPASNVTLYAIYSIPVSDVKDVYLMVWQKGNTDTVRSFALEKTESNFLAYTYSLSNVDVSSITEAGTLAYAIVAWDNAGNYRILEESEAAPIPTRYLQTVKHYKYDIILKDWIWFDTTTAEKLLGETFAPTYLEKLPDGYKADHIDEAYIVSEGSESSAYYTPITYKLTFDANGGTVSPTEKEIIYQDVYGELPTPSRIGHTFQGWYTEREGGVHVVSSTRYEIAGDSTLYAHWKVNTYNVVYDYWTNGGTSVSAPFLDATYGSAIDLSVTAEKEGWEFLGWNTNPDATEGLSEITMSDKDMVLYAIYKKDITASFIDGTNGNIRTNTFTIYNRETSCTMPIPAITEIEGWTSLGWSLNTDADALLDASPNTQYQLSEDACFYGCYVQDITVSYDTNGSAETITSQTKERFYNASGNYKNPMFVLAQAPHLSQHSFVNWEEQNADGNTLNTYSAEMEVAFTKDTMLTARWDKYPEIESYDRYFTLEEALNGEITADRLLEKVAATDKEDGTLENGKDVIVKDYDKEIFTLFNDVSITYEATDRFGNTVEKTITVHVVDTTVRRSNTNQYIRFINMNFFLLPTEQGGLEETSIWKTNPLYTSLLEDTLSLNTPKHTWTFTKEELK